MGLQIFFKKLEKRVLCLSKCIFRLCFTYRFICILYWFFFLQILIDLLKLGKFSNFKELVWKIWKHLLFSKKKKLILIQMFSVYIHLKFLNLTSRNASCIFIGTLVCCIFLVRSILKLKVVCFGVTTENCYFSCLCIIMMQWRKILEKQKKCKWHNPKGNTSRPYTIIKILTERNHSKSMLYFQLINIASNEKWKNL